MTDEVAELVLDDNRAQTLALVDRPPAGAADGQRPRPLPRRARGARAGSTAALEFLPTDKQIAERQTTGVGLTTPEFAVLIAYTKNANVAEMLAQRPARRPGVRGRPRRLLPAPAARALRRRDRRATGCAGRSSPRQLVNQMVNLSGHLVRPPDDRGHRRRRRRRHPGVGGVARHASTSPRSGTRSSDLDRHVAARRPARACSSTAAAWSSAARCGCCATAGRRSTSPRRSPSSASRWPSSRRPRPTACRRAHRASAVRRDEARGWIARACPRHSPSAPPCGRCCTPASTSIELAERDRRSPLDACASVLGACSTVLDLMWLWDGIGALPRADRWQTQARRRCATTC